jgi:hypothetical protein
MSDNVIYFPGYLFVDGLMALALAAAMSMSRSTKTSAHPRGGTER